MGGGRVEQDSAVEEVAVGAAASVAASELDNDPIATTILVSFSLVPPPVFDQVPASILVSAGKMNFQSQLSEVTWRCLEGLVVARCTALKVQCALCWLQTQGHMK